METLFIIGFNFILYYRSIGYGLVVDDRRRYKNLSGIQKKVTPKRVFDFVVDRLHASGTFGKHKKLDHFITLILHTVVSCLIYIVFGKTHISFMAALLFSANPSNNQGSLWMHGRRYVINTIIVLLAYHFRPYGILAYPVTTLFQANAFAMPLLFGHKFVFVLPLFFIVFWNRIPKWIESRKRNIPKDSPMLEVSWRKLILFFKSYFVYFTRAVTAQRFCMYIPYLANYGLTDKDNEDCFKPDIRMWCGVFLFCSTVALIMLFWGSLFSFGLFWFLIFIAQWCNFVSFTQTFAERYLYLANVGIMLALASLLGPYSWAVFFVYATVTSLSMRMYKDFCPYFEYHINLFPGHPIPFVVLAKLYFNVGDYHESFHWVKEGMHRHKTNFVLWWYCAVLLAKFGQKKDALEALNKVMEFKPHGHSDKVEQNIRGLRKIITDL